MSDPAAGGARVPPWLALAAGSGAVALVALATGDVLLLALGLAAVTGTRAAIGPVLVCLSIGVRAGSVSLAAASGAQAVLGPAGVAGPSLHVVAAWLGSAALVLAARPGPAAIPLGLTAGWVVAGPEVATPRDLAVRAGGALIGVAVAALAARLRRRWAASPWWEWLPGGAGALGFVLAVVG